MSEQINISIIDDHDLFRQGLRAMLEQNANFKVVGDFANAKAGLDGLNLKAVDLILMDVDMPEVNGILAAQQAKEIRPAVKVIMLSMHHNFSTIKEAMAAHVDGYLLKTSDREEVERAILQVMQKGSYFTAEVQKVLFGSFKNPKSVDEVVLSKREKEVLSLICQEMTTKEIADNLFISAHTVETHRRNLLAKTGSKNTVGLIKFAIQHHLM